MAHWLVTGGAGFIGSRIVHTLISMGEKVRVLDNFFAGKKEFLDGIINKIELIEGDIRDIHAVAKSVQGVDYVLHQAALRSVPRSVEQPYEYNSVNVDGTLNCLIASAENKVKRFVFASSSSVYGDTKKFPQEESDPTDPISPYAVSKLAGEYYIRMFAKTYGLPGICLRYFNVFGPKQDPKSKYAAVIPKFIIAAIQGKSIEVHWDGQQARDFTHIDNVVQANIVAAQSKKSESGIYNVGCGNSISLLQIVEGLEKILGKKLPKEFFPKRDGDVRKTYASIAALQKDFNYTPKVTFETGLKDTFQYFFDKDRWKEYL